MNVAIILLTIVLLFSTILLIPAAKAQDDNKENQK
jgi:hypothetical protein